MASTDAMPIPRKNVAFRATFPIYDADGDLVTGATGLDSEVSKDGGAFADCTNEATEIATSSGIYYLDLTSTEMNADTVVVQVKTSSSGAKTTVLVLYPEESGDMRIDNATLVSAIWAAVVDSSGVTTLLSRLTSARAGYLDNLSAGAVALASSLTSAAADITTILGRVTAAVATATGLSTAQTDLTTLLSRITGLLQTKAEADTAHGLLATAADLATVQADTTTLLSRITGAVSLATATTAAAIRSALGMASADLDTQLAAKAAATEVAAIKAKTDNLPNDPADQSQVEAAITAAQGALAILIGALNDIAAADVWAALDDASADKLADHTLRRSWANAAASTDGDAVSLRSLLGAVAKLVNRVGIVGSTLTIYEDNDTTALGTQTLTSDAAAEPITGATTN